MLWNHLIIHMRNKYDMNSINAENYFWWHKLLKFSDVLWAFEIILFLFGDSNVVLVWCASTHCCTLSLVATLCCTEPISRDIFTTDKSRRQKEQITDYESSDNLKVSSTCNLKINLWYQNILKYEHILKQSLLFTTFKAKRWHVRAYHCLTPKTSRSPSHYINRESESLFAIKVKDQDIFPPCLNTKPWKITSEWR